MNRHYIIYFGIVFLTLTGLTYAVSPPPVNQKIGTYDTLFVDLTESKCRYCHASGVPNGHHNLVSTGEYVCTDCHPVLDSSVTLVRDCVQCHDNTFNGMTTGRPHHDSLDALNGHCKTCHGSVVDNYDDGHFIPTYQPSTMTPDTKFKIINQTSGRKWGGCESCHEQDLTATPFIAYNNKTHHRLGNLSGFRNKDNSKCAMCHDLHNATYGSDSIRYCERCHGTASLHNIQWDIVNTSSLSGYGHLGPNDCQGCHASYVAGGLIGADIIIPAIDSLSTNNVFEGYTTVLTIYGNNFVTIVNGVARSSVVVVTGGASDITITPTSISSNEIVVTLPILSKGLYGIHLYKDGNVESNTQPLVSSPEMIINSARKIDDTMVMITGSGFGTYDPVYDNFVNVTIMKGNSLRSLQISNWSDTLINVTSPDTKKGDTATVNSVYGTESIKVTD